MKINDSLFWPKIVISTFIAPAEFFFQQKKNNENHFRECFLFDCFTIIKITYKSRLTNCFGFVYAITIELLLISFKLPTKHFIIMCYVSLCLSKHATDLARTSPKFNIQKKTTKANKKKIKRQSNETFNCLNKQKLCVKPFHSIPVEMEFELRKSCWK